MRGAVSHERKLSKGSKRGTRLVWRRDGEKTSVAGTSEQEREQEKRGWRSRRKQDHVGYNGDFEFNLEYTGKLLQDFKQGKSMI